MKQTTHEKDAFQNRAQPIFKPQNVRFDDSFTIHLRIFTDFFDLLLHIIKRHLMRILLLRILILTLEKFHFHTYFDNHKRCLSLSLINISIFYFQSYLLQQVNKSWRPTPAIRVDLRRIEQIPNRRSACEEFSSWVVRRRDTEQRKEKKRWRISGRTKSIPLLFRISCHLKKTGRRILISISIHIEEMEKEREREQAGEKREM